ncbi:hypothetical protein I6F29_26935 [Bradyrhizobium sp. NBAIM16]|uniref:hypothetical protein n=1 Tax=Bradyrhizobium sp. NBAIM16 TaxID=2793813 RepID=UPI001CD351F8|nr:hypothetical protein [Bradyrhizobium sp. NBAIM16]MCA1429521.1 hypothetical protein [Bradyrhizobium sp. NBAIM16]
MGTIDQEQPATHRVAPPMHGSTADPLLARADAALLEAERLRLALTRQRAIARAICANATQSRTLQAGLSPTIAIALTVNAPRLA